MKGLLIRQPWIDLILSGHKTWEIRGRRTEMRGRIALIESGSGCVVGTCDVVDVVGPLSLRKLRANEEKAGFYTESRRYKKTYAWVVENAQRLGNPVPYRHPPGAVIWVRLTEDVVNKVVEGLAKAPAELD